ncbi:MAG: hypothetical protein AB7Q97_05345 [Gammaproteobacteria bacterium]
MVSIRRSLLAGAAFLLCLSIQLPPALAADEATAPRPESAGNPLATVDQDDATGRALRILQFPEVRKARELVVLRWKAVLHDKPPPDAWSRFEPAIDEYVFNYVLKAVNSDPNHPKVLHVYTPPRDWRGMNVPGSRWGGDNPDNIYRIVPIDGKARYRLDGRRFGAGPSVVTYTLVGNYETSKTLNPGLAGGDVRTAADGTFSITLDPLPANGRVNHIQTRPGSLYLFVRDSLGDWRQRANALSIHRLDPPDAPPMTDEQVAQRAADIMVDGVPLVFWFWNLAHGTPNAMPPLRRSGFMGGLVSQRSSLAEVNLADDEAMVVNVNPAGAAYYALVNYDYWFLTHDYPRITSSLTNAQAAPNPDGTITYVVSAMDPAVHNWIDTGGLRNVIVHLRLQGLPDGPPGEPWIESRIVKLADLKKVLPPATRWVSPEERAKQRAARLAHYQSRVADR